MVSRVVAAGSAVRAAEAGAVAEGATVNSVQAASVTETGASGCGGYPGHGAKNESGNIVQ